MPPRKTSRTYGSDDGLIARAARAYEDPNKMTADAQWARMARHVAAALKANPELTAEQAAKAGRLTLRAEMTRVRRGLSPAQAAMASLGLDASGLADAGYGGGYDGPDAGDDAA